MARIQYNQVAAVGDAVDQSQFEFLLGNVPLGGSTENLNLWCQNVTLPGFSNEAFEVALHGFVLKFRGRKNFERQISATFIEHGPMSGYNKLKAWDEFVTGTESGRSGGYKREYSVVASLRVYDTVGLMINEHRIEGLFPQDVPAITLDGSSSQQMMLQATLSFDRFLVSGVTPL